jgi:hypothetical protein
VTLSSEGDLRSAEVIHRLASQRHFSRTSGTSSVGLDGRPSRRAGRSNADGAPCCQTYDVAERGRRARRPDLARGGRDEKRRRGVNGKNYQRR